MNKEGFEKEYKILEKLHSDFHEAYPDFNSGKNKAIRKAAERRVDSAITLTKLNIERNPEILELFAKSEFGHPFAYDEFYQARYFGRDMSKFLRMIKEKIDSM
jgi:hypothetical protein